MCTDAYQLLFTISYCKVESLAVKRLANKKYSEFGGKTLAN